MREFIIKYWLEMLFALCVAAGGVLYRQLVKNIRIKWAEQEAVKEGVKAILHDRLYQAHGYYINQGYCPTEALKNIEYLYKPYHKLGGNGTGTLLYEELRTLPKQPPAGQ